MKQTEFIERFIIILFSSEIKEIFRYILQVTISNANFNIIYFQEVLFFLSLVWRSIVSKECLDADYCDISNFVLWFQFSFENCKFHIEKVKEGTGRVVVWSMGIQNSYTMEASMGGSKIGSRCGTHFSTQDYEQIGKAFCETLLDFSDQDLMKVTLSD